MVVLPTPGGPHKIMEGSLPLSIAVRSMLPLPVKCSWPISSSSVVGRSRSASGEVIIKVTKKAPYGSENARTDHDILFHIQLQKGGYFIKGIKQVGAIPAMGFAGIKNILHRHTKRLQLIPYQF